MSQISEKKILAAVIGGAQSILEQKSFEEAARAIFDHCRTLVRATSGYVALLTDDGTENDVLFLEAGGLPCTVDPTLPMPIRGLRADAYKTHKAVYHNDFMNSDWVKFLPAGHVKMNNVLFAPLNIEGKTVGILGIANKEGDFTDEDANIASVFGELAAIALRNSRYLDQLNEKNTALEKALKEVKTLRGLLPICSVCRKIRDDKGNWNQIEIYLREHSEADFTHSYCDECYQKAIRSTELKS